MCFRCVDMHMRCRAAHEVAPVDPLSTRDFIVGVVGGVGVTGATGTPTLNPSNTCRTGSNKLVRFGAVPPRPLVTQNRFYKS